MQVKISEITVQDRKRNLGNIDSLKESISKIGLIQPIVISSDFRLIAGFHRLNACRELGWEEIEATVIDVHGLEAELAEIDENLVRNELTALERAAWQHRRKEIYLLLNPDTAHGANSGGNQYASAKVLSSQDENSAKKPSYVKSAQQAQGKSVQQIARETRRGKILEPLNNEITGTRFENIGKELDDLVSIADPKKGEGVEVARKVLQIAVASSTLTIKQAYLQLKKQREAEEYERMMAAQQASIKQQEPEPEQSRPVFKVEPGQVWKLDRHTLVCGNGYEIARNVKADALITDPPYGIDYKPNWNKWDGTPGQFRPVIGDDEEFDPRPFLNFNTVLFFGANYFSDRLPLGGWLCWDKRTKDELDAMMGSPFELAWYRSGHTARRATMIRVQHGGVVNADSKNGNNDKRMHPTQKPVELMRNILIALTRPEETVLDPFAGSGSTLIACHETRRTCIAVEIDPEYCEVILNRFFNEYNIEPCLV